MNLQKFDRIKKLDLWTLNMGISLLSSPSTFDDNKYESYTTLSQEILCTFDIEIFTTAIEAETLTVKGFNKKKIESWGYLARGVINDSQTVVDICEMHKGYWNYCFGSLKVDPFEFLEFVKEKDLFDIPPELKFIEKISESDKIRYRWFCTEIENINNKENVQDQISIKSKSKNNQITTNEIQKNNQIIKKNNQQELSNFIINIIPEINKFDKGMVEYYKKNTNKKLIDANRDELRRAALDFFDNNKKRFSHLKRKHIQRESNYIYTTQRRRGIIGKILSEIVLTELSHLLGDREIITSGNFLYKKFKELENKNLNLTHD